MSHKLGTHPCLASRQAYPHDIHTRVTFLCRHHDMPCLISHLAERQLAHSLQGQEHQAGLQKLPGQFHLPAQQ